MLKRATSGCLMLLLMLSLFTLTLHVAKAQTATPNQAVITVNGVPAGNNGLAVEVTVDTAVVKLGTSGSSDVSGSLVLPDSMSVGVGILSTSATLPAMFTVTVPLEGVAAGTSMVAVGMVLDMLGGTALAGASASVDVSSVIVAASTSTSSSSGSTTMTGGASGTLDTDTFTVAVTGDPIKAATAVNVTVAISDNTVAVLDTSAPTFMGTGATQLLTDIMTDTGVLTAVWNGTVSDGVANITAMLKAGTMAGTAMITVTKVEVAGGTDVTSSVATKVTPNTVTNAAGGTVSSSSGGGVSTSGGVAGYSLLTPTSAVGPGKVAVAVSGPSASGVTLNGAKVEFTGNVGVAIIKITTTDADLQLSVGGMTSSVGSLMVTAGSGKAPKATSAVANNKKSGTTLTVSGASLKGATVGIVPTDREATKVSAKASSVKATYAAEDCIPKGTFVNVSTSAGTSAAKVKARGTCSNTP